MPSKADSGSPDYSTSVLARLATWCHDHRRLVVAGWVVGIVAIMAWSQVVGAHYTDSLTGGTNSPSAQAQSLLAKTFPATAGASADIVFQTPSPLTTSTNRAMIERLDRAVAGLPDVRDVTSPFKASTHQLAPGGHIGFSVVHFDEAFSKVPDGSVKKVVSTAETFGKSGFSVALGGQLISRVVTVAPGPSEGIGITAAMIIILLAFGSVVAMGLPIITALFGILIGIAIQILLSHLLTVPIFAPEMLAMIGLGVGIDYALFIVTRYRRGLADGLDPRPALANAMATSGRAVFFAGCTVVISLVGLFIVNISFMRGLAIGSIVAVLMVMGGALTLLPALLAFSGRSIDRFAVPWLRATGSTSGSEGFWFRWSRMVQRRPWRFGIVALLVLVILAMPLGSMRQAFTDAGNDPTNLTTRQAYDLLAKGFGPGFNGPLVVVSQQHGGQGDTRVLDRLDGAIAATPGVAFATPARVNPAGTTAVIIVFPTGAPESASAAALVQTLRHDVVPSATSGSDLHVLVGGETAGGIDAAGYLSSRLPWVIALVIVLALVLLLVVFRSIVIPIKAALMNLLSVAAAYGVIVAVFQWGWAGALFGIGHTGPIDPWIPMMMFTILFGLSMDYEVFLLSRMREEWLRTKDASTSVADGLATTARVITAAAAIMVCVFGSFVIGDPLRILKVFGTGLAAAILIDATLVRMVLVPSIMEILGPTNWYLPRWLDRVIPRLEIDREGPTP